MSLSVSLCWAVPKYYEALLFQLMFLIHLCSNWVQLWLHFHPFGLSAVYLSAGLLKKISANFH